MLGRVASRSRVRCSRWNIVGRRALSTTAGNTRSSWDTDGSIWTVAGLLVASVAGASATTQCDENSFQINQVYTISKVLGEGAYGKVYKAKRKCDGQIVALKTIHQAGTKNDDFEREINALSILSANGGHPHVCRMYDMHKDGRNYYLAMELIAGGELFEHLIQNGAYSEQVST